MEDILVFNGTKLGEKNTEGKTENRKKWTVLYKNLEYGKDTKGEASQLINLILRILRDDNIEIDTEAIELNASNGRFENGEYIAKLENNHGISAQSVFKAIDVVLDSIEEKKGITKDSFVFKSYEAKKGNSNDSKTQEESTTQEKVTVASVMSKGYKQVIFTGAPGTGKTYSVRKYIESINNISEKDWKFVQFHPSYDYSDFVEGLRPVMVENSTEPTFVRMDGVFKAFCRHIVHDQNKENADKNKKYYFVVDEINRADLAKVFGELMFGLEESYRGIDNRFDTQYKNLVTYEVNDEGIATPMDSDVFEEGFYIPENLIFIGTMNDIDRSVESFDFALRRRFQWEEIKANAVMEDVLTQMLKRDDALVTDVVGKIKAMNDCLSKEDNKFGLTEAYHIGPAYFKTLTGNDKEEIEDSLAEIFKTNIVSIIKEYTRGRNPEDVKKLIDDCAKILGVEYDEEA